MHSYALVGTLAHSSAEPVVFPHWLLRCRNAHRMHVTQSYTLKPDDLRVRIISLQVGLRPYREALIPGDGVPQGEEAILVGNRGS